MSIRKAFADALAARCAEHLPDALGDAWGGQSVTTLVESLRFQHPALWDEEHWAGVCEIAGELRAELYAERLDALAPEALIASVLDAPVNVDPPEEAEEGTVAVRLSASLIEQRDSVRDGMAVVALRFEVGGHLLRRLPELADYPETINDEEVES